MSTQQLLQITPPESVASSPPTPPATEEKTSTSISQILREVRRHKDGHSLPAGEYWLRFPLDEDQYDDFQRQLRKANLWDYHEHKLRHDYFPLERLYILRMPGPLHESLQSYITQAILSQLDTIAQSDSPSAKFAVEIENSASAEIVSKDPRYGSHQPDASFQHFDAQFPGAIFEVSHSQQGKDLSRLADAYILGSDADIRVVVGINVEYKGSKKASISIWRPHIGVNAVGEKELSVVQTVKDKLFRDEEGKLVPDSEASLQLQLQDFATEKFAETFPDLTQSIRLSAETLFSFLERAETKARRLKLKEGFVRSSIPWVKKRRRDSTPPEQLDPQREGKFAEQEQRAEKKAMIDDVSYNTSSPEAEQE
ncbi:uncharacterized protein RAG0_17316 [Rhynchosporium agropyri]|uniref:Uncharacterized protein n=1 Tax=Rhynchosporium agropyri TaxID=914238 RepID=A0A1E1LTM6_9HELO|nr:uncharacterized protein RAG0_17316 [Rhynchosporium agropyri]